MDIFEEIVRMRRAGQRGALATIVHTNGSIPSYESSRMLVREDGSHRRHHRRRLRRSGSMGRGERSDRRPKQPRKMTFNLNHDAGYDAGLICGGTLEIFVEPILPQPMLYLFGGGHVSTAVARVRAPGGLCHRHHRRSRSVRQRGALSDGDVRFTPPTKKHSKRFSRTRRATW